MNTFPTKILLATDGSKEAALAARTAIDVAHKTGSELHVVYVEPWPPIIDPKADKAVTEAINEKKMKRANRLLGAQVQEIEAAGCSVAKAYLRKGGAAEEIVSLAEEMGAGLIVVGSRGWGRLRRALIGSVSESVVRYAHCPVLVVRGGERGRPVLLSKKILLATDGSEDAALAARTAAGLAQQMGSQLHAVHVRPKTVPHRPGYYVGPEVVEHAGRKEREGLEREAQRLLDVQAEEVRGAGGNVARAHLRVGTPDEEIVKLAEELGVGLIVMGSRGQGGVRRALLGSVSDSVVWHAHCPVLVVRKEEEALSS